jgi:Hsp70 protein
MKKQESLSTNEQKSLAWIMLHDQSPVSYGVDSWYGYEEMIPRGAVLPQKVSMDFVNIFDYSQYCNLPIYYRRTIEDVPIKLLGFGLGELRPEKQSWWQIKITMHLGKDLIGRLEVKSKCTKSRDSITFDGGVAFRAQVDQDLIGDK